MQAQNLLAHHSQHHRAKYKSHKTSKIFFAALLFTIQTLGLKDLSGCFLVHFCVFYSSYSSYFAFLFTSSKIFRAKMEPVLYTPHIRITHIAYNISVVLLRLPTGTPGSLYKIILNPF